MVTKKLRCFAVAAVVVVSLGAYSGCGSSNIDACRLETVGTTSETISSGVNLVANPSMETVAALKPSEPDSWKPAKWGTNTTSFTYDTTDANTGSHSVRIDISSWSSGDAKWMFDSVPVSAGTTLIYRDYYKSTVTTKLVAAYQMTSGSITYVTLAYVPAKNVWSTVAAALYPPEGVSRVTVYHLIAAAGTLQLDDVSLSPPREPDMSSGVPNGSLEQTSDLSSDLPLAWRSSSWGSNTASFTYSSNGHNSGRCLTVTLSNYINGDAKWYFDPQAVTPGTRYLYSDYYISDVASFLSVRVTMSNGSYKYINLGVVPAAFNFTRIQADFLVPAGAVAVTVFHGISRNGTLQIDDAALSILPPATLVNGVPNGDLEELAFPGATAPAAWHPNVWGTNTATFSYPTEGHSGSRCVRIDVSSYTTGAASWYFDPQPVTAGQPYRVTTYYRSSADITILAMVTKTDGTSVNLLLPVASSASDWTAYSSKIYLPADAASATLYFKMSSVGWVEIDDVGLAPTTTLPFARGIISITFDDGWATDYSAALPILNNHAVPATHYIITSVVDDPERLSLDMLKTLQTRGDEIASHTLSHYNLTTLSAADLETELSVSRQFLEANGFVPALNMASPYGAYNNTVLAAVRRNYQSHRTVDIGYNSIDDFDIYRLKVQHIFATTTVTEVNTWAAQAAADRSWLIVVYHDVVAPSEVTIDSTTPANLDAQLTALQSYGLPIVTLQQALEELVPQVPSP